MCGCVESGEKTAFGQEGLIMRRLRILDQAFKTALMVLTLVVALPMVSNGSTLQVAVTSAVTTYDSVTLVKQWYNASGALLTAPPTLSQTVTINLISSKAWLRVIYPAGDTANPILTSAVDRPDGKGSSWPAEVSATFNSATSLTANSTKDLSNVVLQFADGSQQKYENLSGYSQTFAGTGLNAGKTIIGAWIHSGNNYCGDPNLQNSYGTYFGRALMITSGVSYTVTETGLPSDWSCASGQGTFTSEGASDTHTVRNLETQSQAPAIKLVKTAGTALDGEVYTMCGAHLVTYTYAATNTGFTWLKNLTVTDDKLGTVGTAVGPVAPGASAVFTLTAPVSSTVTNVGTVVATPCTQTGAAISGASQVSGDDPAIVAVLPGVDHESVTIVKQWYDSETNLLSSTPALVTNVTVVASNAYAWSELVFPEGDTNPPVITSAVLKPEGAGANWPDLVSATFDSVSKTVTACSTKNLSNVVLKFADGAEQKFDSLTGYSQTFAGTGANTSKDIVGIWIKSGANASGDGPGFGSYVAPALMITSGTSYVVTETGLPEGWSCASGLGAFTSNSGNGTHTVKNQMQPGPVPGVRLIKTAGMALDGDVYTLDGAAAVTYTYRVQNAGNTWLKNLTVTDDKVGAIGTVEGPLAPSATATLTKTVMVSATVTNVGTVTATPCKQSGESLGLTAVADTDDAVVRLKVLSALGDLVWLDDNANGIQDAGETGIAGVTVSLCNASGTALGPADITDANGRYLFENLLPGSYAIRFAIPSGYVLSSGQEGDDQTIDSNADPETGLTPVVVLAEGTTNLTLDAGLWHPQPAVNLIKTAGTCPDGATCTIVGPGTVTYTYVVKNTGNTWLENLAVNDNKLGFIGVVSGWLAPGSETKLTADATVSADVTNVGTVTATPVTPQGDRIPGLNDVSASDDAVVRVVASGLAALGDRVWVDANANGVQDAGELGLVGVTVTLRDAEGTTQASTVTASDGSYLFDNLEAGTYSLHFALPSTAWRFTSCGQGPDPALDSDVDPSTGLTAAITLSNGQRDLAWDAGVCGGLPPGFCHRMTIGENYNALILGNFTATGGDTGGRLAVGGTARFNGGYSIGLFVNAGGEALPQLTGSADMLIVRGDLYDGSWGVNGDVVYGGAYSGPGRWGVTPRHVAPVTLNDNGNVPDDGSGYTFEQIFSQLRLASAMISTMSDCGVATKDLDQSGDKKMTFVGTNETLNVFNVNASDWSGAQMDILIAAPEYSTVVFNIHGSAVELSNGAIRLTGITNDRILFNYADATEISTSGFTHEGAVMAPYANGTFSGGAFEGFGVFGGNVTTSTGFEFHRYPFRGSVCTAADAAPAISLETTAGDAADGAVLTVLGGSAVTVSYRVTNVGNTSLDQIQVVDSLLGAIGSLGQALGAGKSATLTATLPTVTSDTVLHGAVTGRPVHSDGTRWNGYANVTDTDDATIKIGSPSSGGGTSSAAWQRADFAVTAIEFVSKPTLTCEVFSVQVTINNHGELAADAGRLTLYLAAPGTVAVGAAGVAYQNVGVLMPGESKTILFQNLTAGTESGTQHLRAYVDSLDRVCEWSEGDNQLSATYTLNPIALCITVTAEGAVLSWNSYWGQKYTLYRCTDLNRGFLLYKSHVEATPPENTYIDADVNDLRFYRLVVEEQE